MDSFEGLAKRNPKAASRILKACDRFRKKVRRIKGLESLTLEIPGGPSVTLPGADAKPEKGPGK